MKWVFMRKKKKHALISLNKKKNRSIFLILVEYSPSIDSGSRNLIPGRFKVGRREMSFDWNSDWPSCILILELCRKTRTKLNNVDDNYNSSTFLFFFFFSTFQFFVYLRISLGTYLALWRFFFVFFFLSNISLVP